MGITNREVAESGLKRLATSQCAQPRRKAGGRHRGFKSHLLYQHSLSTSKDREGKGKYMQRKCKNCIHFSQTEPELKADSAGRCRAFPPTLEPTGTTRLPRSPRNPSQRGELLTVNVWQFPIVSVNSCCRFFETWSAK